MSLIERYTESVKSHISNTPERVEEIGQELKSLLEEKCMALEEEKGRALDEHEIVKLLKDYGPPFKVASAYSVRTVLVSEASFPLYKRVLGVMLSLYLVGSVGLLIVRMQISGDSWGVFLLPQFLRDAVEVMLFGFFAVTAAFHYMGDYINNLEGVGDWDPRKLPSIRSEYSRISLKDAFVSVFSSVFALTFFSMIEVGYAADNFSVKSSLEIEVAVVLFKLLAFLALLLGIANLYQRYWTRLKLLVSAAINIGAAVTIIAIMVLHRDLFEISVTLADTVQDSVKVKQWLEGRDYWIYWFLVSFAAVFTMNAWKRIKVAVRMKSTANED